jgi:predicted extracellular nuclease
MARRWPVTVTVEGLAEIENSLGGGVVPQFGNLNVPTRVRQLNAPFAGRYWFVYQNVQPSTGSTAMLV